MKADKSIKDLILKMCDRIKEAYQPDRIILFGSFAYGNPTDDSDVDLLIVEDDARRPIDRRVDIRHIVREENRKIALTLLVYTPAELEYRLSIGDDFVDEVLKSGEVLYAR